MRQNFDTASRIAVGAMLFLFPLFFLTVDHWGSTIHALLALFVLIYALLPKGRQLTSDEKRLFIVVAVFILSLLLTYILVDQSEFNHSRIRRYARIVLVIPVIMVLLRVKPKIDCLWYGVVVASILIGILGMCEWLASPAKPYRIVGNTNSITHGDVTAALFFLSFSSWSYFKQKTPSLWILPVLACVFSLIACFLSGTRTSWLAVIVVGIFCLWIYRHKISYLYLSGSLAAGIVLLVSLYFIPQSGLKLQADGVYKNLQQYHANGDIDTSLGARIEMWKVAGDIFKENPILGAGADEFRSRLQEGIKSSRYSKIYNGFSEPHSAYVTALSSRGLLGFLALLALIIVPLHAFSKGLRDQQQRNLAVTGITFILIFAVLGLSASVFETPRLMTFFSFYLAVIFSYFSDIKQTGA